MVKEAMTGAEAQILGHIMVLTGELDGFTRILKMRQSAR
jgi:hypothetical protein